MSHMYRPMVSTHTNNTNTPAGMDPLTNIYVSRSSTSPLVGTNSAWFGTLYCVCAIRLCIYSCMDVYSCIIVCDTIWLITNLLRSITHIYSTLSTRNSYQHPNTNKQITTIYNNSQSINHTTPTIRTIRLPISRQATR